MVNINLNQEDSYKEQSFKEDDTFQQTLNIESHDFADDRGEYGSEMPEFPKSSNNTRIYILAGGLLIIVFFIFYLLYLKDDGAGPDEFAELSDSDLLETPIDESAGGADIEATDPTAAEEEFPDLTQPEATTELTTDLSSLSPIERDARISSHLGKLAIDGITSALGGRAVFTLVRFSNNSFLVELVAGSGSDVNSITADISANTGANDLRIISQEPASIQGRNVIKMLLSGTLTIDSAPGITRANPGSTADFSSWARSAARSNQLSVKKLAESAISDANLIQINLDGSLPNALGFLNAFEDVASNVFVEKISLLNNDLSASSDNSVSLVMVLKQYRM